jgi:tetratricopeptide (TPR) repeat protein
MTFASLEPGSELTLVPLDNPDSAGTKLKNPATLPTAALSKQAIRIASTGKSPIYWFAPTESGRRLDIRIKQLPACSVTEINRNRPVRVLLKAYQALTAKDYNLAHQLSAQAGEIDPTLSAPYIISGLAWLQQGKGEDARVAFNKARALDPEDQDIVELLRLAQ